MGYNWYNSPGAQEKNGEIKCHPQCHENASSFIAHKSFWKRFRWKGKGSHCLVVYFWYFWTSLPSPPVAVLVDLGSKGAAIQ